MFRAYFASHATTAASAMARATSANRRAFSSTLRPRCSATILVISKSWPGGLYVWSRSFAQKNAISVCSGVRAGLTRRPSSLTSLNCAAYSGLRSISTLESKPPGRGGRNCDPCSIAKGRTPGQFGLAAATEPDGRQSPGLLPETYGVASSAPSCSRSSIMAVAAALPTALPAAIWPAVAARPARTFWRSWTRSMVVSGNAAASVSCAACAMAASIDASGFASNLRMYGSCVGTIELTAS